jgi:NAD-dependent SIR2 family protein deacetylase
MYIIPAPHRCPDCGNEFHWSNQNPFPWNEAPFCPACYLKFLKKHVPIAHELKMEMPKTEPATLPKELKCYNCGDIFRIDENTMAHVHFQDRKPLCEKCCKAFLDANRIEEKPKPKEETFETWAIVTPDEDLHILKKFTEREMLESLRRVTGDGSKIKRVKVTIMEQD